MIKKLKSSDNVTREGGGGYNLSQFFWGKGGGIEDILSLDTHIILHFNSTLDNITLSLYKKREGRLGSQNNPYYNLT